jgi:hypothetical protein
VNDLVTVIVALIALAGSAIGPGVLSARPKHRLEMLVLVREARQAASDELVIARLQNAELHLAKQIELRYRVSSPLASALLAVVVSTAPLSFLTSIGALVITIAFPDLSEWTPILSGASIVLVIVSLGTLIGLFRIQQRESQNIDAATTGAKQGDDSLQPRTIAVDVTFTPAPSVKRRSKRTV